MGESESGRTIDGLLLPFLMSRSAEGARELLGDLLERHLNPVIHGVVRRKLHLFPSTNRHGQDAEDVVGEATARLIERLQALRGGGILEGRLAGAGQDGGDPETGISNLTGYAATVASSVCDEYLRRKYPRRRRLKNRVRYLLTHRAEFGLWEAQEGESHGGFAAWRSQRGSMESRERLRALEARPEEFERAELGGTPSRQEGLEILVSAIFRWVRGPIEVDQLVSLLADLLEVHEYEVRIEENEESFERRIANFPRSSGISEGIELRVYLSQLWLEICDLPPRQRCAVLLNLRDDKACSAIELFPLLGVATIPEIAAAIDISVEEFAGLWNDLPLEDTLVAGRLGVTRQQVINLRKSARERLGRRMRN